jgi:multicomponent Na+:H+ antiporter subunit G
VTPREIAIVALVAVGVFFAIVAVVGLLRLPDLYTRAHGASKADTLAAVLSLAAVAITFGLELTTLKTVFLLVFMFLTNPTAAHAITRAAAEQGIDPWTLDDEETDVDSEPSPATTTTTTNTGPEADPDS